MARRTLAAVAGGHEQDYGAGEGSSGREGLGSAAACRGLKTGCGESGNRLHMDQPPQQQLSAAQFLCSRQGPEAAGARSPSDTMWAPRQSQARHKVQFFPVPGPGRVLQHSETVP